MHQIDTCLNKELKLDKVLHFMWVPTEMMPADYNLKPAKTFTAPEVFLQGPNLFREVDLTNHIYATYSEGKFQVGPTFGF